MIITEKVLLAQDDGRRATPKLADDERTEERQRWGIVRGNARGKDALAARAVVKTRHGGGRAGGRLIRETARNGKRN